MSGVVFSTFALAFRKSKKKSGQDRADSATITGVVEVGQRGGATEVKRSLSE